MTRTIIGASPPDLIHSHRYKENILAILAVGRKSGIKLIATQHGMPELAEKNSHLIACVKYMVNFHMLSRYFTKTVAVSEDIRHFLVKYHAFRNESVEVIHNGINIPCPFPSKNEAGPFVIGSSGRLVQVKDYPLMVEIARILATFAGENVRFELAGEGPERSTIEALIQRYGFQNRFILKGHQNNMDTFYRGLDLYLNTSVHEGIPMTILEALAQGLPVIAPAVGGIDEIIDDGVQGFLVDDRNPRHFAEKCLFMMENKELREKMSKAARDKAEQAFSAGRMAESYYQLYCQTVYSQRARYVNNATLISRVQ